MTEDAASEFSAELRPLVDLIDVIHEARSSGTAMTFDQAQELARLKAYEKTAAVVWLNCPHLLRKSGRGKSRTLHPCIIQTL
jgi:hypothetical protein